MEIAVKEESMFFPFVSFEENDSDDDYTDSECRINLTLYDEILNRVMENTQQNKDELQSNRENGNKYYNPQLNKFFKVQMNRLPLCSPLKTLFARRPITASPIFSIQKKSVADLFYMEKIGDAAIGHLANRASTLRQ